MMLGRVGTSRLVAEKFGKGKSFDKSYFLHLCEIYMRNEKRIFDMVATHRPLNTARAVIKFVVEKDVIDFSKYQGMDASISGIISGVGGHIYYQPLLNAVTQMVQDERDRREKEGAL